MNLEPENKVSDDLVVFACQGGHGERLEMAAVLRSLAQAIETDRYTGCAHLVMESRWLDRLQERVADERAASAS